MKAQIKVGNHFSYVLADRGLLNELIELMKIKAPGYFYSEAWRKRIWDGKIKYVTDGGRFLSGLIDQVVDCLKRLGVTKISFIDTRNLPEPGEPVTEIGNMESRDYQANATRAIFSNNIEGVQWIRGILGLATNAGKTYVAATIYESFGKDLPMLFVINRVDLWRQISSELTEIFGSKVGTIGPGGNDRWLGLTVAMAQTLSKNLNKYATALSRVKIVVVDECHYATSKTYSSFLSKLEGSSVRIGMSGTALKHKDKNKNQVILGFFGKEIIQVRNKELIDKGHSTPVKVTIINGNKKELLGYGYDEQVEKGIISNKKRNLKILKKSKAHFNKGRKHQLIVTKYVRHCEAVYAQLREAYPPEVTIAYMHVNTKSKERKQILEGFKTGEIKILVSTLLIKEGHNLKLIQLLIYAAGGESAIQVLQIVGRILRKSENKTKGYIVDFFDKGKNLAKHSRRRIREYQSEGFEVVKKYTIK